MHQQFSFKIFIMHTHIIKIRSQILVFLTHNMALPFLKFVRKPLPFPYTMKTLSQMQDGVLGKDLYKFLISKNLALLPYYAKHDIKHILLDYDTTDEGEVCLQCFMLGNKHISFPVAATVLYGFLTMPEYWKNFWVAYKRGAKSASLKNCKWFEIVTDETKALKKMINT